MDSLLIHQQANDLVQNFGTRNIKKIALNVGMEVSETDCFHDLLGLFAFQWHDHMIFINQHIDKYTKQMVCGYALGHYLKHPDAITCLINRKYNSSLENPISEDNVSYIVLCGILY